MAVQDSSPFQQALASFKDKLGPEISAKFAGTKFQDVKQDVLNIQKKQISARRLQNMNRLHGFILAMEQYGKVIEVFLNASDILAFVWGPIKFLLQIVGSFSEAFNGLLDTYQLIGESLPLLEKCQGFLEDSPFVNQALESIYRDILDFHYEAIKYFRRPLLRQIFQETWPRYKTKFGPIIESLKRHKDLVEGRITFTQLELGIANGTKALEELERQREHNESIQLRAVKCWLNSADIHVDQDNVSAVRSSNRKAGQWLLKNHQFQTWQSKDNNNNLLWLCGIPGAGKTVLASLVVEDCARLSQRTIWFYCKHGDRQRSTFTTLASGLISQLLDKDRDLLPYIYEKMCCRGESILSSEKLAKELLETFLKSSSGPSLYIIIDGLDECDQFEEKQIIEYMCSMMKSSQHECQEPIYCLLISQSDAVAVKFLQNVPKIDMKPSHNREDIVAFVKSRAVDIQEKFWVPDVTIQTMIDQVVERAGGMFLYAKLVMSSLFCQVSQHKLLEELHSKGIPNGLAEAYSRVLAVALDQNSRTEALQLLGWLVCAKRQLKWREVQGAVSIDLQGFSVEFESRQWVLDPKDLCGSLVQLRSDGSLELVHSTAKSYLISSGTINLQQEELGMASLCLGYLSLPGFDGLLAEECIKELIYNGYYAFLEYAACHWVSHLEAGLHSGSINGESTKALIHHLQRFLKAHYRASRRKKEIRNDVRQLFNCLQLQSPWRGFEDFLDAYQATENQIQTFGESAIFNDGTDIPEVITRIRKLMEEIKSDTNDILMESISVFYGDDLYKCPRMSCDFFYVGFSTFKQRDSHIMKHDRPFSCSYAGCLRSTLSFSSQRELERHILHAHKSTDQQDHTYPSKRKRHSFKCRSCKQNFSEPDKFSNHACKGSNKSQTHRSSVMEQSLESSAPHRPTDTIEDTSIARDPSPGVIELMTSAQKPTTSTLHSLSSQYVPVSQPPTRYTPQTQPLNQALDDHTNSIPDFMFKWQAEGREKAPDPVLEDLRRLISTDPAIKFLYDWFYENPFTLQPELHQVETLATQTGLSEINIWSLLRTMKSFEDSLKKDRLTKPLQIGGSEQLPISLPNVIENSIPVPSQHPDAPYGQENSSDHATNAYPATTALWNSPRLGPYYPVPMVREILNFFPSQIPPSPFSHFSPISPSGDLEEPVTSEDLQESASPQTPPEPDPPFTRQDSRHTTYDPLSLNSHGDPAETQRELLQPSDYVDMFSIRDEDMRGFNGLPMDDSHWQRYAAWTEWMNAGNRSTNNAPKQPDADSEHPDFQIFPSTGNDEVGNTTMPSNYPGHLKSLPVSLEVDELFPLDYPQRYADDWTEWMNAGNRSTNNATTQRADADSEHPDFKIFPSTASNNDEVGNTMPSNYPGPLKSVSLEVNAPFPAQTYGESTTSQGFSPFPAMRHPLYNSDDSIFSPTTQQKVSTSPFMSPILDVNSLTRPRSPGADNDMLKTLKPSFDPSTPYASSNTTSTSLAGGSGKPGSRTSPADVVMWRGSETKTQRDSREDTYWRPPLPPMPPAQAQEQTQTFDMRHFIKQ